MPLLRTQKSSIHTFLSDFNTPLCSSVFPATCSSLYWISGTHTLESQWLSLTPTYNNWQPLPAHTLAQDDFMPPIREEMQAGWYKQEMKEGKPTLDLIASL